MHTTIRLGNYLVEIPMLAAKINDDCILGVDFLEKINLGNIFESIFHGQKEMVKNNIQCYRVEESFNIPSNLRSLFEKNSKYLNQSQKELFAKFLIEFREIFAEEIVAGNCEILGNM
ncbi:hypothetical protein ALC57_16269 [Trachymyrmex cornetzi]|uniref:Uncharacterized protein n=1 Tax=Trachymyrmex cornetzi TaxID=471704 RepID=A0A151IVD2_9HYME|nr:hypothetical protein ALC57_16269 [Trachymyrmex cornetzi]